MSQQEPTIVKCSGGRSSGKMLLDCLRSNKQILKPGSADVVIFNNTTAEHPATYDFILRLKEICEQEYGIPFLLIEFQTYEDAGKGGYQRYPTYRLVTDKPYDAKKEPYGFRSNGEAFEELLSWKAYLPSRSDRICTLCLKIMPTNAFISDWLSHGASIPRQGHFGKSSYLTDDDLVEAHHKNKGQTPREILLRKRQFVRDCMHYRPEQRWRDYTSIPSNSILWPETVEADTRADLYGQQYIDYTSLIGIRSDEAARYWKIRSRVDTARDKVSAASSFFNQPPGEEVRAPLMESNDDKQSVIDFWAKESFDLALDPEANLSNCVFCPLKSVPMLQRIADLQHQVASEETPTHVAWWASVEKKYGRNLKEEKRQVKAKDCKHIGFFGKQDKPIYAEIWEQVKNGSNVTRKILPEGVETIPCECTD